MRSREANNRQTDAQFYFGRLPCLNAVTFLGWHIDEETLIVNYLLNLVYDWFSMELLSMFEEWCASNWIHDAKHLSGICRFVVFLRFIKFWQNGVLVLQLYSKGQVHPSTFKKTNLVPQLLYLGQIHPYINVMLHNTMRLMRKFLFTLCYFLSFIICMLSSATESWSTCAWCSYMIKITLSMKGHFNKYETQQARRNNNRTIMPYH